jgi:hypothetical protein
MRNYGIQFANKSVTGLAESSRVSNPFKKRPAASAPSALFKEERILTWKR